MCWGSPAISLFHTVGVRRDVLRFRSISFLYPWNMLYASFSNTSFIRLASSIFDCWSSRCISSRSPWMRSAAAKRFSPPHRSPCCFSQCAGRAPVAPRSLECFFLDQPMLSKWVEGFLKQGFFADVDCRQSQKSVGRPWGGSCKDDVETALRGAMRF